MVDDQYRWHPMADVKAAMARANLSAPDGPGVLSLNINAIMVICPLATTTPPDGVIVVGLCTCAGCHELCWSTAVVAIAMTNGEVCPWCPECGLEALTERLYVDNRKGPTHDDPTTRN
jgi:hypothetical protein